MRSAGHDDCPRPAVELLVTVRPRWVAVSGFAAVECGRQMARRGSSRTRLGRGRGLTPQHPCFVAFKEDPR